MGGLGRITAQWTNGRGQDALGTPAAIEARLECPNSYSEVFFPRLNRHAFAIMAQHVIPTRIVRLLSKCRPAAILWGVRAVVVNAIKGMVQTWTATHISQESVEAHAPAIDHIDPASTILWISWPAWIVTAPQRVLPNSPFRHLRSAINKARTETAATALATGTHITAGYYACSAAFAKTFPIRLTTATAYAFDYRQMSRDQPGDINISSHMPILAEGK